MKVVDRLRDLFEVVAEEAEANPKFARRLETALRGTARPQPKRGASRGNSPTKVKEVRGRTHRRSPAKVDPFQLRERGTDVLREALERMDLESLKDVVAEFGMDTKNLAMKWRQPDRLVDLILSTVESRIRRGNAFRTAEALSPLQNSEEELSQNEIEEIHPSRKPEEKNNDRPSRVDREEK